MKSKFNQWFILGWMIALFFPAFAYACSSHGDSVFDSVVLFFLMPIPFSLFAFFLFRLRSPYSFSKTIYFSKLWFLFVLGAPILLFSGQFKQIKPFRMRIRKIMQEEEFQSTKNLFDQSAILNPRLSNIRHWLSFILGCLAMAGFWVIASLMIRDVFRYSYKASFEYSIIVFSFFSFGLFAYWLIHHKSLTGILAIQSHHLKHRFWGRFGYGLLRGGLYGSALGNALFLCLFACFLPFIAWDVWNSKYSDFFDIFEIGLFAGLFGSLIGLLIGSFLGPFLAWGTPKVNEQSLQVQD